MNEDKRHIVTMNETMEQDLEMFVDGYGIEAVTQAIRNICHAKASQLRETRERKIAGLWGTAGGALGVAVNKMRQLTAIGL